MNAIIPSENAASVPFFKIHVTREAGAGWEGGIPLKYYYPPIVCLQEGRITVRASSPFFNREEYEDIQFKVIAEDAGYHRKKVRNHN